MYQVFSDFLNNKQKICIIQAENPDGDSIGSAIALDYLLTDKEISLYCPIDIPKYLRYFTDWSRITNEFDFKADGYIIVDTAAEILLSKLLENTAIRNRLYSTPVLVIDHHETPDDLNFPHESIIEIGPATAQVVYHIAKSLEMPISREAAEVIFQGILSDTLGLTSSSVTEETFEIAADLTKLGASVSVLEERRKDFMRKSPRVLDYKADLIKKIDYSLDGILATVHITWDEIREYSDEYNPNALILEELRMVEGVKVGVAVKTYPDGKVTGKIRSSSDTPIAEKIAGYFGGGGHPLAAGFRTYDMSYEDVVRDLVKIVPELIQEVENEKIDI